MFDPQAAGVTSCLFTSSPRERWQVSISPGESRSRYPQILQSRIRILFSSNGPACTRRIMRRLPLKRSSLSGLGIFLTAFTPHTSLTATSSLDHGG